MLDINMELLRARLIHTQRAGQRKECFWLRSKLINEKYFTRLRRKKVPLIVKSYIKLAVAIGP